MRYLYLLFLLPTIAMAQDIAPLAADRPDQTETPYLVPKGMFQMENGFSMEKDGNRSWALPSSLLKYGLNDAFELRLIVTYVVDEADGTETSGFEPIRVGMKVKICEEAGWIPKTSLIGHMLVPDAASSDYRADYYASQFRFVMQHTLTDKLSLSYNLGAEWDGITPDATFIYTLTTGFSLTEKWGAYAELFGFAPENDSAAHSFDGGFTYLVNNDTMLDISSGFGITENAPDYYIALGFSFRL
ncbi:MAG TPA: transporter [Flavobacterium sp.]|nr:transporter [Flavobacterium sp.]